MNERTQKPGWSDWLALGLVVATAPVFLFPRLEWTWAFFLAPVAWMLRLRGGGGRGAIERTPLDWGIGLLVVQIFATCLIVPDLRFSLPKIAGTLFGIILFYSALAASSSEKALKMGTVLYLSAGFSLAVFGVVGMILSPERPFVKILPSSPKLIPLHNWKLPGAELGINPNALAGSLCLVIPLALVLLFSGKSRAARIALLGITSFVFLAVIFLSQAVGAWIALFLSLVLIGLRNRTWVWTLFGSALLLILILLIPSNRTLVWKKIEQRSELWSTGVTTIQKHPIFGVGMNRLRYDNKIGYKHAHAHNQLIHTAAELGIPGLVAYLAMLIGAAWMCVEVSKRAKMAWMRAAARGLGTGQLALLIFGMGDAIPLGAKTGAFFWVSLALITAIYKHVARQENAER